MAEIHRSESLPALEIPVAGNPFEGDALKILTEMVLKDLPVWVKRTNGQWQQAKINGIFGDIVEVAWPHPTKPDKLQTKRVVAEALLRMQMEKEAG